MSLSDTDKRLFQKAGKVMMTLRFEDLTHRIVAHRTVSAYLHICSAHRVQQERLLLMFRQIHHILVRSWKSDFRLLPGRNGCQGVAMEDAAVPDAWMQSVVIVPRPNLLHSESLYRKPIHAFCSFGGIHLLVFLFKAEERSYRLSKECVHIPAHPVRYLW